MTPIIDIRQLTKRYGKLTALDRVTFSVPQGSVFGLIGPDGAGKTTLYQILTTLSSPDEGSATVIGLDVVKDYKKLRTEIGYMPERFSLYPDLTVRENLHFFASLFGVDIKKNFDLIAPIFSQLEKFPNRRAGALSGGMKQKLALSCALIHRPKILLLDEPTTGVDAVSRSEFWDMLTTLKEKGITILVSTSYMDEAERCEYIALINKGKILDVNSPGKLMEKLDKRRIQRYVSAPAGATHPPGSERLLYIWGNTAYRDGQRFQSGRCSLPAQTERRGRCPDRTGKRQYRRFVH